MQDEEDPLPPGIVVESGGGAGGALTVEDPLPATVLVYPLHRSVAFPNLMMPVLVDTEEARAIIAKAEAGNRHVLLLTQRDPEADPTGAEDFYEMGVVARILTTLKRPDGNQSVMMQGRVRARIQKLVRKQPQMVARVQEVPDVPTPGKRAKALYQKLQEALNKVAQASEQLGDDFQTAVLNIDSPEQLADFTGAYLLRETDQRQALLELIEVGPRLEKALEFVLSELELQELGNRIQQEIREKTEAAQKQYFLREQLKIIRRELGEEVDAREAELERFTKAVEEAGMPEAALERAQEELQKLRTTPVESAEYGVVRNYLEWLTAMPWSKSSEDREDLAAAEAILHEDHHGLEEVKERMLEFLAVRQLEPNHSGSILCFAGPPGVGKTSLGRSIARAIGREFYRFSLGGMRDESEIKGHRRTYVGAMPGRIVQALKATRTNNPVILLDEIDKLGSDYRGDPSSALLEVLDPEQNHAFLDHYLDVRIDLSRVMFLATANVLPSIPAPLRDRMEIIELPGYLLEEKVQIARRHLLPKQLKRHGLKASALRLGPPSLRRVVSLYTREAGVRGLDKQVIRMCRKAASMVARGDEPPGRVSPDEVEMLLGPPRFAEDARREVLRPGVVQGLAWTSVGGDVLYIESMRLPKAGGLTLTGSLGDVMSESVRIALSYLRGHVENFELAADLFQDAGFHVHFPAGAIPKDGPSAGITIAISLLSLLRGRSVPRDIAMTGELTLVGEVLAIGGVREKVLAAKRFGIKRVILPESNRSDVEELKPDQQKGLEFLFAEQFEDVERYVFGAPTRKKTPTKKTSAKRTPAKKVTPKKRVAKKGPSRRRG
ncbi:MAG: endopeptidase La [Planctomycetota bacterium]